MTISYQWLMEYLPENLPVSELSRILTSIGLEVEGVETIEKVKGGLKGLVTGHVLTCEKHPNADKLSVTTVDIGGAEPLKIVCGAPNVAAGQKVIVAPPGTTVHPTEGEPFQIKKAKIRGEESSGMICAEDEIGLSNSHAGIMILPAETPVGLAAKEYFGLPDADIAIHIALTPNRSDANSHIGVARDICAYLTHHTPKHTQVVMPHTGTFPATGDNIKVSINNPEACPRYAGISIDGVQVGPSPEWLQQRLATIGVRSINNVVDVTNYVLHEYGQPLHAFDADKLKGNQIIVQLATEGSTFVGLDDKERKLQGNDLMICDAVGPVAMGGVFGGNSSGIQDGTSRVFLESAYFTPMFIRRSSIHHALRTDAATHFEKGVDINNVTPALLRAAALIVQVAGGHVSSGITDVFPAKPAPIQVTTTYNYLHGICGKKYGAESIKQILTSLGFIIENETAEGITVAVPTNKADVSQPADLAEEILRIDGLDNVTIPSRLNISLTKALPGDRAKREHLAGLLCGMGVQEIVTNSIVNSKYYPGNETLVRMINSLSAELDVMRPSMLESGLEVVRYNINRKSQDLCLFEFGNTYSTNGNGYAQSSRLAIWVTGNAAPAHWQHKAQSADIYYLKGLVSNLAAYSGINLSRAEVSGEKLEWKWKNQLLVTISNVAAETLRNFDIKQPVYFADINWELWAKAMDAVKIKYSELSKYPAVARDLAIVVDKALVYKEVEDITNQLKINELTSFGLFDVFESDKLGAGKKSLALNFTFQLTDRTLTDAETEQLMKKLVDAYKSKLNAQIRE